MTNNFIVTILKTQFYGKHWIVYFWVPFIIAFVIVWLGQYQKIINDTTIGVLVSIIGITWGLLLNFLAILLTSTNTYIDAKRNGYEEQNIYGIIYVWKWIKSEPRKINFYDFIYYKIFFLIFFSIAFIFIYIWYFLELHDIFLWLDKKFITIWLCNSTTHIFKDFAVFVYIFLVSFYFMNFGHLVHKIYYFFHKTSAIPQKIDIK